MGVEPGHLGFAAFCAPFVILQWVLIRRAHTWPRRLLALYWGMLAAIAAISLLVVVPGIMDTDSNAGQLASFFVFYICYGHIIGIPGLALVGGINFLAYQKLGLPGLKLRPGAIST